MDALPVETTEVPALLPAPLRVVAQRSIFREPTKRIVRDFSPGSTLLDLVLATNMGALRDGVCHLPGKVLITIDGHEIDRDFWHVVRPNPGTLINICLVPQGGREAIMVGASLAIAVAAIGTGGAGLALGFPILGAVGAASLSIGGAYDLASFPLVVRPE